MAVESTYTKITGRKAIKVTGEVAEIIDRDQLELIEKSFEDKLIEIRADIAACEVLGIEKLHSQPAVPEGRI